SCVRAASRGLTPGVRSASVRRMAAAVQPWPLVRQGDAEHPVRTLQHLLRAHGKNVAVDGIFGPATDAAVRTFQGSRGLAVDGIVGPHTWSALMVVVRRGSRGAAGRGVPEELLFGNLSEWPRRALAIARLSGAAE